MPLSRVYVFPVRNQAVTAYLKVLLAELQLWGVRKYSSQWKLVE
jgi:hypothetical protein